MMLTTIGFSGIPEWQSEWLPSLNNTNTTIPNQNHPTSGAVNAVAPHPTDPNVLFVATVNGGIWRTRGALEVRTDGYRPTWTPLTDRYATSSFGDIVFDRFDPSNNTLWASVARTSSGGSDGGPLGGLLRTSDQGNTWVPMARATLGNQNVIKVVPTRLTAPGTSAQIVLAASNFTATGGVFRSTDGGNTFTRVSGAAGSGLPASGVSDLVADVADGNVYYAAVPSEDGDGDGVADPGEDANGNGTFETGGLFRSRDGGVTWTAINNGVTGPGGVNTARRIRFAATRGALYAAIVNVANGQLSGVFRLANPDLAASTNWAFMGVPETPAAATGPVTGATNAGPIVITSANHGRQTGTRVRIAGVGGNGAANGDWQITVLDVNRFNLDGSTGNGAYTGGGTWTALAGIHPRVKPGGQGNTHLSLVADPNNANLVYIGGDRSNNRSAGNLWRGNAAVTPNVWASIVDGNANNTAPHADSRDLEFDASGNVIEADDGGVARLSGVGTAGQVWQSVVGTLEAHEIYSVRNTFDGPAFGTQDTGTPGPNKRESSTFTTHYDDWSGGDGGFVGWDGTSTPNRRFLYVSNQNLGGFRRHVFDQSSVFKETQNLALTVAGAGGTNLLKIAAGPATTPPSYTFDNTIQFIQPYVLNRVNPRQILVGTNFLYESNDQGDNFVSLGGLNDLRFNGVDDDRDGTVDEGDEFTPAGSLGGVTAAMIYGGGTGANMNAAVIYAAAGAGIFLRQSGSGAPAAIAAPAGVGAIRDIAADPDDWKILYVLDANGRVYQTNDATASPAAWANVTGDLGNILGGGSGGAADARSIEVYKSGGTRAVFVGGSGGVFFTTDADGAHWREFGNFLPNVIVKDLQYDASAGALVAGTWGRGAWSVYNLNSLFTAGDLTTLRVKGDNESPDERNLITLAADPNIAGLLRLSVSGAGKEHKYAVEASALDRIRIEGGGADDVYNIADLPAGIALDIDVQGGNALVSFYNPNGTRTNVNGTVVITGGPGGTTRLLIDDSGDSVADRTVNVATPVTGGAISGLTQVPLAYTAAANVNNVHVWTSRGGNNTVNVTATGVPTWINFNRTTPPAAGSTINIGNAGSVSAIQGLVTIADNGAFDTINVRGTSHAGSPPLTLDQFTPPGDTPFARLVGLSPAPIHFKLSDLMRFQLSTATAADAIVVSGPGVDGHRQVLVNGQGAVTVRDMTLDSGLVATAAPGIRVLTNILGPTRVVGASGARLDGNRMTSLVLNDTTGVTVSNNPAIGTVLIGTGASNVTMTGNTVTGLTTVTGPGTDVLSNNTLASLLLIGTTAITATDNAVSGNVDIGTATSPFSPVTNASFQGNTIRGTMTINRRSRVRLRNNTINRLVAAPGTAVPGAPAVAGDDRADIDAQGNRFGVVELLGTATGVITGNEIGWRDVGVGTLYPVALNLAATFGGTVADNDIHNAVVGVRYAAPSPLVGNRIFGNTTGVVASVNDTAGGLGFFAGSGRNEVYNSPTGVNLTGRMQNQHVHDNVVGVIGSGILGGDALELANLIASNLTGADFAGTIQFNRFSRNDVGVLAHERQVVIHNLVYRGTAAGVRTRGADDVRIVHNTFYNTAGNAVQVDGGSTRTEIGGNIFQADAGYNIHVADDSRAGYFSDYNDLYTTGAGTMLRWGGLDFDDVVDLQQDIYRFDLHSIGTSAVNPTWAAPRFVNLAGDDYRVTGLTNGQHASSPTVDAGMPFLDVPPPPGFRNLLSNGSFESGTTAGWVVNVGGATAAAEPFVYAGSRYFAPGGVAAGFAEQTANLIDAGFTPAQLDGHTLAAVFGARVRSAAESPLADDGRLVLTFLDGSGAALPGGAVLTSGHTTERWELLGGRLRVPAGTRSIRYRFEATRQTGTTNDAYLDGAFLDVRASADAPDLGAYGNVSATDLNIPTPHLQVLSPTLYADWEAADPHVVEWQTFGNAGNSPVKIEVLKDGGGPGFPITIVASAPDTGSYSWIPSASGLSAGTLGLRIKVSLVSDPSVSDTSAEPFALPEAGHAFYVNDGSTAGDEYATAVGDNRNTGRRPDSPKPSLEALLRTYRLGGADIVYIDTGIYDHVDTIVLGGNAQVGGDQGVTITGPVGASHVARINGQAGGAVFDVNAGNFVTLSRLTLSGGTYGVWVRNGSTRFTGTYLTALASSLDGVRLEANAGEASLDHVTVANAGRDGISVSAPGVPITNSTVHDSANAGFLLTNAGNAAFTGNESYNNRYGLHVTNNLAGTTTRVGDANLAAGLGNRFHDNRAYGVWASSPTGAIAVAGNTAANNGGAAPGGTGVGILLGANSSAASNVVYGHARGIVSDTGAVTNNRVFNHSGAGISLAGAATAQGNVVYSNQTGIYTNVAFAGPAIRNNLVYANSLRGIWINGSSNPRVENNTVYQPTGDAVRIDPAPGRPATGVVVRNNVLWTGGPAINPPAGSPPTGYAVVVDPSSEIGFQGDFNLLFTSGGGKVGYWEGADAVTLADWRTATSADGNSLSKPPAFVDFDGADNLLGFTGGADRGTDDDFHEQSTAGSFHGGSLAPVVSATTGLPAPAVATLVNDAALSPALDRGDPASAYTNETAPRGGAINLGAFGNTAQASRSPTSYVTVLQPDGGESALAGHDFTIRWTSQDAAGTVVIELLDGATPALSIAAAAANSGSYVWAVPTTVTPGSNYFVRVTRNGVPAASDTTDAPFSIGASVNVFYVNDGTVNGGGGDWTTAPGNDANSGRDAAHPKASVRAVLAAYNLGAGDVIRVDDGTYVLSTNIAVTPDDSGVKIEGYHDQALPSRRAVLTRGAAAGAVVFDLQGADDVTLDYLRLVGPGATVGITAGAGADSDRITISNSEISGFPDYGILVHGTNDNWTVAGNRIHDNVSGTFGTGIAFDSLGGAFAGTTVRDNVVFNHPRHGISIDNAGPNTVVTGNEAYANGTGISVGAAQAGAATISGNKVHDNISTGIAAAGAGASVTGNTAWAQRPAGGFGYGVYTSNGATAGGNVAYGNNYGVFVNGGGTASNNRAYNNSRAGVWAGGSNAVGNVVYGNLAGIEGEGSGLWANNLAYDNTARGLYVRGASQPQVINNTVYQPTGDALTIESTHNNLHVQNIRVRNNILWAQAGYAIVLGTDTAPGLQSDYNDLYATGTGRVGSWENVARSTLAAWQQVTLGDANSISADPRFVNVAGGDFHEQSTHGSFHGGSLAPVPDPVTGLPAPATAAEAIDAVDSPAVDAGRPTDPAANEPLPNGGFVNLGAYGNTAQASKSATTYIQVTRPNGGEAWSTRQTFPVLWRGDNQGTGLVDVELLHRGAGGALTPESTIASGVPNSGRYDWVIPQAIPAASDYVVRVTRRAGGGATAASDASDAVFSIGAGTGIYYVNDATFAAGDWTTAPGDDANSGLDPAHPKATIAGVLAAYAMGATDVIRVDAGNYLLSGNVVVTPADSGVTIRGYSDPAFPDRKSVLDRGSRATNAFVFEIAGADDVTVDRLSMTGAFHAFVSPFGADADRLTLTNSEIYGSAWYGVYVGGQNDDWTIAGNRIYNNYLNLQTESAARAGITGNLVYGATFGGGIRISNGLGSTVSGNEVYGNASAGITADSTTISSNLVHDNAGGGIFVYGGVVASGNTVYGHTARNAIGIYNQGAEVRGNTVYRNYDGLTMNAGRSAGNRVFNNSNYGINIVGGTAQGNVVYSNLVGITAGFSPSILGNLVYGNTTVGISIASAGSSLIEGNTVYQSAGDALRASLDLNNTRLNTNRVRNNILWASGAGGYAINITNDSDTGFQSDYNNLYATGPAKVARWSTQEFTTRDEWAWELGLDTHGVSADPLFVDLDGPDNVLGYRTTEPAGDFGADDDFRLQGISAAIDAGDPASPFTNEPAPNGGRVNLGHHGNTPDATGSGTDRPVQILSPNGGEKLQAGRPVTVEWRALNVPTNSYTLQLSLTGGTSWTTLGSGLQVNAAGRGALTFTPTAPGENALLRVIPADAGARTDVSDAPFQVAPAGRDFYVNDGSTAGDVFTTAAGANANHGKSPDKPMASIAAVLASYDLEPGDVIHVDAGSYDLFRNIVPRPDDSGARIEGAAAASPTAVTRLDRRNTGSGLLFDFRGADNVTLDHLAMTGAASAVVAYYDVNSDGITVSNSDIFGNADNGVFVATSNDNWTVAGNRVHDNTSPGRTSTGISFAGNFNNAVVRDNVVFNHPRFGIRVEGNFAGATVSRNEAYGNGTGIYTSVGTVADNRAHHNVTGFFIDRNTLLVRGNAAWSNTDGLVVGPFDSSPPVVLDGNRAFDNAGAGINGGGNGIVRNNQSYSNGTGLVAPRSASFGGGQVYNNVVYANRVYGILYEGATGGRATNNTVYQPVGDAVRVQNSANVGLFGNVLWVEAGADLYVAANGQAGFKSDGNVLYHGPGAQAVTGFWGGANRASLADWRGASAQDANSVAGNPSFVDVDGADNVLGYNPAGAGYDGGKDDDFYLMQGSPAIDHGYSWPLSATDVEGFGRADDPGTPNAGSPDYAAAVAAGSAFAQSGTSIVRSNNGYVVYDLPFAFPLYDGSYTRIWVSTEGVIHFEGPDFPFSGANNPAEFARNRRVAPLWDNINVGNVGDGVFADVSAAGQAKFMWKGINEATGAPVNFSAVLFSDGRVRFDYGAGNTGLTPTVGLSRGDGQHFMLVGGYDGAAALTNARSVNIGLVPGRADAGAYEFRGSSSDATPPTVTATLPGEIGAGGSIVVAPGEPREIGVSFSEPINSIDARAAGNFLVTGAGGDNTFGTADDFTVAGVPRFVAGSDRVTLDLPGGFPSAGIYRLTVFGSPLTSIHDLSGIRLDGNGDGTAGGDFVRTFTVSADASAPTVTAVWVGGTGWSGAFGNAIQSAGLGSAAYGFSILGGAGQLKSMPWSTLDRVSIRFSEAVAVARGDLVLAGVNVADYGVAGFSYDADTFTATWTLARRVRADKLLLRLDGGATGVRDLQGNRLDGEWLNPAATTPSGDAFPSGDGAQGGHFALRLNVLPGDTNGDGRVTARDLLDVRARLTTTAARPGRAPNVYSVLYDVNTDGRINISDEAALRAQLTNGLPGPDPYLAAPSSAAPSASLATTLFSDRRVPPRRTPVLTLI